MPPVMTSTFLAMNRGGDAAILDSRDGLRQESSLMKPLHFIPLGLALAGLAIWSFSQHQSTSALATQSQALQQKIATTEKTHPPTATPEKLKTGLKSADQPLDWKNLAQRMAAAQEGESATTDSALESYELRLAKMTTPELLAALDEISALGLDAEARSLLEESLVEALITQDPALALAKFPDRIQDESDKVGWQLAGALGEWAKRDLAASTAWLDREIAAGRFESKSLDGQSEARLEFEAALLGQLLATTPKAAAARLAAMPEDQRRTAMEQIDTEGMGLSGQQAYMDLLREFVPQAERGDALSYLISQVIPGGDSPKVTEFLNAIHATPEERNVAWAAAAGSQLVEIASERAVTGSDVDQLRTLLTQQTPTAVDRLTGEALAQAIQDDGEFTFVQAAALVADYHQRGGNDDIITAFLASTGAGDSSPEAIALAGKINDPKRREAALADLK